MQKYLSILVYCFAYINVLNAHIYNILSSCGKSNLTDKTGIIQSPSYPKSYDSQIQCEWLIQCSEKTLLKLEILDLDLDNDCSQNWLSVPFEGGRGYNILCGQKFSTHPITVAQPQTFIKYYSSELKKESRGFALRYTIEDLRCGSFDVHCQSGECVSNMSRCDGIRDCRDGSDELGCPPSPWCSVGSIPCPSSPHHCYSVTEQLCNGYLFCPYGEDELSCAASCPNQIACFSGEGCYDPAQRCNGIRNCRDNSDETGCTGRSCAPLEFICRNALCVRATTICDGKDDCGDASDEEHCSKSTLLTAATIGLLACACLSCIGLSLIYRFYATRLRTTSAFLENLEPEGDPEDGFTYREPPPSYSVAVAESYPLPRVEALRPPPRRNRRRPRRTSRGDSRSAPMVAPPFHSAKNMLSPPYDSLQRQLQQTPESLASVSPSRESITSSTSVEDLLLQLQ